MSSHEVLEGKITQVHPSEPHTSKAGNETTKQLIIMSVKGILKRILCYGMEDMAKYRDKIIRIKGLSEMKGYGSYMANNYASEIDDRVESDPYPDDNDFSVTETESGDLAIRGKIEDNITPRPIPSELSKFTVEVKRSKDYQTISLSEEFTGSFAEIDAYWSALDEKAKSLLLRMPKL